MYQILDITKKPYDVTMVVMLDGEQHGRVYGVEDVKARSARKAFDAASDYLVAHLLAVGGGHGRVHVEHTRNESDTFDIQLTRTGDTAPPNWKD